MYNVYVSEPEMIHSCIYFALTSKPNRLKLVCSLNFEVEIPACVFKTQRSRGPPLGWLPGSPDWSRLFGGGAVAISPLKAKGDGAAAPFLRNTLTRAVQTHFPPSGATENGRKSNANFQTSMSSAPNTQLQRFRACIVFASRVRSGAYVEVKRTVL